jgi:hypothetical protein
MKKPSRKERIENRTRGKLNFVLQLARCDPMRCDAVAVMYNEAPKQTPAARKSFGEAVRFRQSKFFT